MRYMLLLNVEGNPLPEPGTPEWVEVYNAYTAAEDAMAKAGVLLECAPLQPASTATIVRVRNGETLLTDGPAAEIKEQLGGFLLLECANLDEALKWAATVPAAQIGSVEVRAVVDVKAPV